MITGKKTIIHLLCLWFIALVLRVVYMLVALQNLGMQKFWTWTYDTNLYWTVSEHILAGHESGGYALLRVGPGYGMILAGIRILFDSDPLYAILFSVVMGSLAPVFIYLLAMNLIDTRRVALSAGLISAVSLISITLSCLILTDQAFFTLFAAALVCYVRGFRTGNLRWFVAAGLIGAAGALVRPSGEMCFLLFLFVPLVIPIQSGFSSRWDMIKRAGLASVIMLLVILSWSTRNYVKEDLFVFSANGVYTLQGTVLAQVKAAHTEDLTIMEFRQQCEDTDSALVGNYVEGYRRAKDRILDEFLTHPNWFVRAYFSNLDDNIKAYNYDAERQIPAIHDMAHYFNQINRTWLAYTVMIVAFFGLVILLIDKNYLAGSLLGITFAYFTLIIGLSFWQGSRLHYPAEIAWAILVTYALHRGFQFVTSRLQKLRLE